MTHESTAETPIVGPQRTSGRSILAALFIVVRLLGGRGEAAAGAAAGASEAEGS